MIDVKDQEDLFSLISKYLTKDVSCYAIGGTAMMFYGYKTTTKDIDLVFTKKDERDIFIDAITELGYKETSLKGIYDEKRRADPTRPLLFSRGDERFDIFLKSVFGFTLDENLPVTQRHDYPQRLTINLLPKEHLILLKSITGRPKDFEDITSIIRVEKIIDWDALIDAAIGQTGNSWLLLDLEETLQKLKSVTPIPARHFKRLYKAQADKSD
jgi:hypothetical protein